MPKYNNPVSYAGRKATQNVGGQARFATATEAAAGAADDLIISPSTLDSAVESLVSNATTTTYGLVRLDTDGTLAAADNTHVPTALAAKTYIDSVAIAGAPTASESQEGIAEIATTAEAQAGTDDARIMTAAKVVDLLETPPAIGGTTPAAGSFTTLAATGAIDFDAGGSFESGGAAIDIGADASADAINIGTGAAARTITLGNATGATQLDIDSGTGGMICDSTGAISLDAAAASNFSVSGAGIDLNFASSAGRIIATAGEDAADCIYLHADAGTSEAIRLHSDQGTGAASIQLESDVGGITLTSGLASADAINIAAASGGFDVDCGGQINIASSQNAADSIVVTSSAGGIDILANSAAAGEDIDIQASSSINLLSTENVADCIYLRANGGTGEKIRIHSDQGTGNDSIELESDVGGVTVTSGKADAACFDINLASGGMTVDAGLGISLDAAGASNFSTSGAGIDLDLASAAGRVIVTAGEDAADAIYLHADAGTSEKIRLHADQGTATDSVILESDDGGITLTSTALANAAAIDINSVAGGVTVDAALGISLDAAGASNFSTSGAGIDLDLASAAGRVIVTAGEDAADCIYLHADAGTSEKIRIHSDQGTSVDSVELESDVGGITLTSGLASADAINLTASAGGVDVDGALQVNIASSQAATGAVTLAVSNAAGNITLTGAVAGTPDSITSDNAGVAASINTLTTLITTDGDSNEDNVTLADGLIAGQIKHFAVIAAGNAADSIKITPANMAGGTKITFAADPTGLGCSMVFDGTNWTVFANNGGTIA